MNTNQIINSWKFLMEFLCIFLQIWTAQKMIQQVGVTLPEEIPERHLLELSFKKVNFFRIIFIFCCLS